MSNYSQYIQGLKKRVKNERQKEEILYNKLNREVRSAIKDFAKKFNLKRVYLFGSLVRKENFHKNSDIDLAVEGLKSEKYLQAWGELEEALNHPFDLVQIEKATGTLKEIIKNEGVIIYEDKKC